MFNTACQRSGVYTCRLQPPKVREVINRPQQENAVILFLLFWHALAKKLALLFNYKQLEKGRHMKLKEIPSCLIPRLLFVFKPGSYMPPMHLRHGRQYCLGYCSGMRAEVARGNIGHPSLYRWHACKADSSSSSQACRQHALWCFVIALVAGGACSHLSEK